MSIIYLEVFGHLSYLSDIIRLWEVHQISVIEFLRAEAVLPCLEFAGFNSICLQKLLICHTKCLANGLRYNLCLQQINASNNIIQ